MRVPVVVRSVAVLLAAPMLALPTGHATEDARGPVERGSVVARARAGVVAREIEARRSEPILAAAEPPAQPDVVSVSCSNDGCVVQDGLDVLVVSARAR